MSEKSCAIQKALSVRRIERIFFTSVLRIDQSGLISSRIWVWCVSSSDPRGVAITCCNRDKSEENSEEFWWQMVAAVSRRKASSIPIGLIHEIHSLAELFTLSQQAKERPWMVYHQKLRSYTPSIMNQRWQRFIKENLNMCISPFWSATFGSSWSILDSNDKSGSVKT